MKHNWALWGPVCKVDSGATQREGIDLIKREITGTWDIASSVPDPCNKGNLETAGSNKLFGSPVHIKAMFLLHCGQY